MNENKKNENNISGTNIILLIVGAILVIFILTSLSSTPSSTNNYTAPADTDSQMEEIYQVANSLEDYLITYEATGLIKSRKVANGNYVVIIDENLWIKNTPSHNRNLIRYALAKYVQENGLPAVKIIGNNTQQEYQIDAIR